MEFQDVKPGPVAVDREDVAPIVDLEVVRLVPGSRGVGVAFRYIEPDLDRILRLASAAPARRAFLPAGAKPERLPGPHDVFGLHLVLAGEEAELGPLAARVPVAGAI